MKTDSISNDTLVILLLILLLLLWGGQSFSDSLIFDRHRIVMGEWWRLWTGQWVHSNSAHQNMNALGFMLFLLLYKQQLSLYSVFKQIVYFATCVGLGLLLLSPNISRYAGLSGIIYGLFAFASLSAFFTAFKRDYLLGLGVFAGLTTKIIWENIDPSINNSSATMIQATIATDAHLYAYLAALLLFGGYYFSSKYMKQ